MWMRKFTRYMAPDEATSTGGTEQAVTNTTTAATATTATATTATAEATETTAVKTEGHVWPDDWRERTVEHISDEAVRTKELKQLQRYASPVEVHKKARALEQRLSSGELKAVLPKDASPEMVATWRKENGIPELPTGYDLDLGNGIKFVPGDKTAVDEFLKRAHETNQTKEQVQASLKAFHSHLETQKAAQYTKDTELREKSTELLREEWGPEFKRNLNVIENLMASKGDEKFIENFWNARLEDGTPIGSSPEMLKMLLSLALVDNPAATVVPNSTGNLAQSVDSEIASIEKTMKENRTAYNKDEKMQARYRELLVARETIQKRAK